VAICDATVFALNREKRQDRSYAPPQLCEARGRSDSIRVLLGFWFGDFRRNSFAKMRSFDFSKFLREILWAVEAHPTTPNEHASTEEGMF